MWTMKCIYLVLLIVIAIVGVSRSDEDAEPPTVIEEVRDRNYIWQHFGNLTGNMWKQSKLGQIEFRIVWRVVIVRGIYQRLS